MIHLETMYLLILILLALAPGLEARIAIPYGLVYGFNPLAVFTLSYIFSTLPSILIIYSLNWAERKIVNKIYFLKRLYTWSIERIRSRADRIRKSQYMYIALLLYVAIPLPLTGVWTGSLIAYLLGLDRVKSIVSIALGNIIASLLVIMSVLGVLVILY